MRTLRRLVGGLVVQLVILLVILLVDRWTVGYWSVIWLAVRLVESLAGWLTSSVVVGRPSVIASPFVLSRALF